MVYPEDGNLYSRITRDWYYEGKNKRWTRREFAKKVGMSECMLAKHIHYANVADKEEVENKVYYKLISDWHLEHLKQGKTRAESLKIIGIDDETLTYSFDYMKNVVGVS